MHGGDEKCIYKLLSKPEGIGGRIIHTWTLKML
jgi:hypothetical protein